MVIVVRHGRQAAVRADEPKASYVATHVARRECVGVPEPACAVRVVVEMSRAFGGMTMRALLGAEFSAHPGASTTMFEVSFGESMELGTAAHCRSELGRPLVAGLPRDFVDAVVDGLTGDDACGGLPRGLLRVDRAGFDEVGSSEMAFGLAAGLLRHVVDALLRGDDQAAAPRDAMNGW